MTTRPHPTAHRDPPPGLVARRTPQPASSLLHTRTSRKHPRSNHPPRRQIHRVPRRSSTRAHGDTARATRGALGRSGTRIGRGGFGRNTGEFVRYRRFNHMWQFLVTKLGGRGRTYTVPLIVVGIATALPETDDDRREAPVDNSTAEEVGSEDDGRVKGRDVLADRSAVAGVVVCAWTMARRSMMAPRRTWRRVRGCEVVCGIVGIVSWICCFTCLDFLGI